MENLCVVFRLLLLHGWSVLFFFLLVRERERESEEKVYYCCARQILPCFARDYLCLSMCACIRSIHVYMRVRLCSGMYSDVVVAVCCYYGGFFLYISLYSLGFLRYNFFFFVLIFFSVFVALLLENYGIFRLVCVCFV